MALRATCGNCRTSFSAQDEYLGKKLRCPQCGQRVEMVPPEKLQERARWLGEQEQRIQLIENLERKEARGRRAGESYALEYGTGVDRVRNFHPGAVTRFRKLRALSRFLLVAAYLVFGVVLVGAGLTVLLYRQGAISGLVWLVLALVGWSLLLVFMFALFKFLGEMAWLLADLGDHQLDSRNLLIDMREGVDHLIDRRQ